jgi:hypothetical protein
LGGRNTVGRLRIVKGYHLTSGLVVRNNTRRRGVNLDPDWFAIDLDVVTELDTLADVCRLQPTDIRLNINCSIS